MARPEDTPVHLTIYEGASLDLSVEYLGTADTPAVDLEGAEAWLHFSPAANTPPVPCAITPAAALIEAHVPAAATGTWPGPGAGQGIGYQLWLTLADGTQDVILAGSITKKQTYRPGAEP